MNKTPPYIKKDLLILLWLIIALSGIILVLWYLEANQGYFTNLAHEIIG